MIGHSVGSSHRNMPPASGTSCGNDLGVRSAPDRPDRLLVRRSVTDTVTGHDQDVTPNDEYLLDNQQTEAGQRFDALSELFNPSTFRHAKTLGLGPGWHVWEVGAGGTNVPDYFARQVGVEGSVLATDIDTSWLEGGDAGYQVRRHDVGLEPPPEGSFDLVHARLVLVHLLQRERALASMVAAVKPGGWLLLEDADPGLQPLVCPDESGPEQELANKLKRGFRKLLADRGADLAYGRTLPRLLRQAGWCRCSATPTSRSEGRPAPNLSGRRSSTSATI